MTRPIFVPPGGPGRVQPSKDIYAAMGEANIFAMLRDFYLELSKSPIRSLFPEDMIASSEKSATFFVGLLGGPPLYHERYGSPMLRQRHLAFRIDRAARDVWVGCFFRILENAVDRYDFPSQHLDDFKQFLSDFSLWMMNAE